MTKPRKRASPENQYDTFHDMARANDYTVLVGRFMTDEGVVMLQVVAVRGDSELIAPPVTDVGELGASVAGLHEQIEREAA